MSLDYTDFYRETQFKRISDSMDSFPRAATQAHFAKHTPTRKLENVLSSYWNLSRV